jgi:DNA/RNA-binding domain of Phe-tRNA-synthetase-like protein
MSRGVTPIVRSAMTMFRYDPAIVERFPHVVGGAIYATGLTNRPSARALTEAFANEQAEVLARAGSTSPADVPSLAAWRRVFRSFGVDPTTYRSAAEALLRRLTKQGSLPSINTLVDCGNLVSIRYGLPVAVFDLRALTGATTVRLASGEESFTDLGTDERTAPDPGEVIFSDEAGLVAARRWCWRQAAETASGPGTSTILVTVEGHHDAAKDDVTAAVSDLTDLLDDYARPAALASGILDASTPAFDAHDR